MGTSVRDILARYTARRAACDPLHQAALTVRAAYYGDIVLPTPEIDRADKPLVANLLYQGGEQRAMRVASTTPDVSYPSTSPGVELRDKEARHRRLVNLAWWDDDRMRLKLRKRARHLVYYASCPVVLRPDFARQRPTWQVRNPLTCFPPQLDTGDLVPPDVIFTLEKPYAWIEQMYPHKCRALNTSGNTARTFTLLEYLDHDEHVLCVIGDKADPPSSYPGTAVRNTEAGEIVELERLVNRTGRVNAVIPGRIGLEAPRGEFDGVVGLWQAQAMMMALMTLGTKKAIFPEEWLVDHPNQTAEVVTHADPLRGIMGHIEGGDIKIVHPLPEAFANNIIDRLERAFRIESGVPAELGGESGSNIRTGRRGDAVLSAVLDFPIQEEQQLLEVALAEENRIAIAIDKAYFNQTKRIFVSATAGEIEYDPAKLWSTDRNYVRYAHAGVDAQGLMVEMGQRLGMGTLSRQSAMELDPLVEDPRSELDRMMVESTRAGLQQSLTAMAADPAMAPVVAEMIKKVKEGDTEIEDAVIAVHEAIQAAQAQQAAPEQPNVPPEMAQPGMAMPTIPESPGGLQNLAGLLSQLHITDQAADAGPAPTLQAV
jgi:hypothetical protein